MVKLVWITLVICLVILLLNDAESNKLQQRNDIRKKSTKKKYVQQEMSIFPHQPQYITNYNMVIIDSFAIESFIVP